MLDVGDEVVVLSGATFQMPRSEVVRALSSTGERGYVTVGVSTNAGASYAQAI